MKLFVGLGNPGNRYKKNRHNVGFMLIEYLANKLQPESSFSNSTKFSSLTNELTVDEDIYIFAEPQTYMNRSGEPVSRLLQFYKVAIDNLVVAHDDLDIPFGKFKIQAGTGPKLHNGLSSIEQLLGTKDFLRIRIGVENRTPDNYMPGEAYVLQNFTQEEHTQLKDIFEKIYQQLQSQRFIK